MSRRIKQMAKFALDQQILTTATAGCSQRTGHLTLDLLDGSSQVFKTPAFFIHTLGGSVPHISAEVLDYIYPPIPNGNEEPRPPVQISIDSVLTCQDVLKGFGQGIGKFVGLPTSPVFLTLHNPLHRLPSGYNDKAGVAFWSRKGRTSVSPKGFEKIVHDFKPTLFQGLSDYDVSKETSLKRMRKSTTRAIDYLNSVLENPCKSSDLFVTIETSWFCIDEDEAVKTLAVMCEKQQHIRGFVLSGLSNDNELGRSAKDGKLEILTVTNVDYKLVERIISKLPKDKPKYAPGPFSLVQIAELVSRGVDLFDSSSVTKMADDAEAFHCDFLVQKGLIRGKDQINNEALPNGSDARDANEESLEADEGEFKEVLALKEKRYFSDFSPISRSCSCYTCRHHTRAYINHLYATDELLGPVLLMIHNLTAFTSHFSCIRSNLESTAMGEKRSQVIK